MVKVINSCQSGRKEMFYLTTHSTHFIDSYMVSAKVKDYSDSERENPLYWLHFSISNEIIYMHHPINRIAHTTAFVNPVIVH